MWYKWITAIRRSDAGWAAHGGVHCVRNSMQLFCNSKLFETVVCSRVVVLLARWLVNVHLARAPELKIVVVVTPSCPMGAASVDLQPQRLKRGACVGSASRDAADDPVELQHIIHVLLV